MCGIVQYHKMELSALSELGLSQGQVEVFQAVLELGRSTLNAIHEKTGIERRNIYDIINKLIERGLIVYTLENRKRTYQCVHPNILTDEIKKKEEALSSLKGQIPEIRSLFESSKQEPQAEIYRGNEAIKALLNESLDYKEHYWIGGNSDIESTNLKTWYTHWNEDRRKKRIMLYDLVDFGTYMKGLEPNKIKEHKRMLYKYCQWQELFF